MEMVLVVTSLLVMLLGERAVLTTLGLLGTEMGTIRVALVPSSVPAIRLALPLFRAKILGP